MDEGRLSLILVATETLRAPTYHTRPMMIGPRMEVREVLTKEPTGAFIEQVFKTWRCRCGALAVTVGAYAVPGKCGKCR